MEPLKVFSWFVNIKAALRIPNLNAGVIKTSSRGFSVCRSSLDEDEDVLSLTGVLRWKHEVKQREQTHH